MTIAQAIVFLLKNNVLSGAVHRSEDMFEVDGFIVCFFSKAKVEASSIGQTTARLSF